MWSLILYLQPALRWPVRGGPASRPAPTWIGLGAPLPDVTAGAFQMPPTALTGRFYHSFGHGPPVFICRRPGAHGTAHLRLAEAPPRP